SSCGRSKWAPKFSSVRCLTAAPTRTASTRRWVKYASPVLRLRVLVRRMNMRGEYRAIPGQATEIYILWHYISCHSEIPRLSANSSCQIRRKSAESPKSGRRWAKLWLRPGHGQVGGHRDDPLGGRAW